MCKGFLWLPTKQVNGLTKQDFASPELADTLILEKGQLVSKNDGSPQKADFPSFLPLAMGGSALWALEPSGLTSLKAACKPKTYVSVIPGLRPKRKEDAVLA